MQYYNPIRNQSGKQIFSSGKLWLTRLILYSKCLQHVADIRDANSYLIINIKSTYGLKLNDELFIIRIL